MATNAHRGKERIEIPSRSTVIGVDADGSIHRLGNRVAAEGIPVYVTHEDGELEVFDLTETPCYDHPDYDDPVEAWIAHVEHKRGDWARVEYGRSLVDVLGDTVAPEVAD